MIPCRPHADILHTSKSSSCRTKSCVPACLVSINQRCQIIHVAHKNKTAHHVQASTETGEEGDLVGGDHPLAAGL
jgi:hypothetical protein